MIPGLARGTCRPDHLHADLSQGRGRRLHGCVAHISDIGGRSDYLDSKELFEEGLRIPPMKLVSEGVPVKPLFQMIAANVRVPRMVIGDIHAILGAERLGAERLIEFLEDYRMDDLDDLAGTILERSEAAMAAAIESLPDGTYSSVLDIDGHNRPVRIAVKVTIRGARIRVDFTGSSDERPDASINCVMNTTVSDTYYPFKCSLLPELPNNEGLYRFLDVHAPLGSIFNTRFPRSVRARSKSSCHIHSAIYDALSGVLGNQVHAGSGSFWTMTAFGTHDDGEPYRSHMLPNGGKGAVLGRDGLPTIAFPYNGTITPAEIFENNAPVLIGQREFLADSAGPGQFRGGLGQHITLTSLCDKPVGMFCRPDKMRFSGPRTVGGASRPGRPVPAQWTPGAPGSLRPRAGRCHGIASSGRRWIGVARRTRPGRSCARCRGRPGQPGSRPHGVHLMPAARSHPSDV